MSIVFCTESFLAKLLDLPAPCKSLQGLQRFDSRVFKGDICRKTTVKENLIDKLHEADMLYFVLGSLISADSLVDNDACHKALNCLEHLKQGFKTSKLKDDLKLKSYLDNAESIIQRDMEIFKKTTL